jgi:anti-sigma factor RsiW
MTQVLENDLQAFVDGVLDEVRRTEVETYLAERPEEVERLRAYRAQDAALRALFDPVLAEPVPAALVAGRAPRRWRTFALAASVLFAGVAIGWIAHGTVAPLSPAAPSLARSAAIAHAVYAPEVRHPVEVGADQEDHLVKWLSKRLGTNLRVPKLATLGYDLVGGRLLSGPQGPVAQFMYQDARGQRLTLYVSTQKGEGRDTAFRFSQEDRVSVFYWIDHNYGYALSGEIKRDALLTLATAVYQQLSP